MGEGTLSGSHREFNLRTAAAGGGGEVTYRAAAGVHLALRTANAAGGGAGCEGVAHIELREVPEEERDGP